MDDTAEVIRADEAGPWNDRVDVLVAGYGIAGACAAVEAHRAGASGGLHTDVDAHVLDAAGRKIPGLFAAGACAAHISVSGKGYGSGMSLGPGSCFGRVAGRNAARA